MPEVCSLDAPVGKEDDPFGVLLEDTQTLQPFESLVRQELKDTLEALLGKLDPRQSLVLRLRFGLDNGRARTLEEVGKEFNVTRERIRQIEAKALRKLRHPVRSNKFKDR